jgi:hypothetical protein
MEQDVGSDALYLDVIEIVKGKKLPYILEENKT